MPRILSKATTIAMATALGCAVTSSVLFASSHREAPFITESPKVDGTDFYMFRSYEAGRGGFVTLIANYMPLQDSYGGPNYFTMDPNALYEIHVDNNGDAQEDITFQFRFLNVYRNATVPTVPSANGPTAPNVSIPLVNIGPGNGGSDFSAAEVGPGVEDVDGLNVVENYRVTVVRGDRRSDSAPITDGAATNGTPLTGDTSATLFRKPVDNIGEKTIPNYAAYANNHIANITIPGCPTAGRVFAGQRREGFVVNLGAIFDRINLDPFGGRNSGTNILDDKNITSLALELPIRCLTSDSLGPNATANPVIGAWTTASLRQARVLNPRPLGPSQQDGETNTPAVEGGAWTQVSRLGSPLVNEVVIGLTSKDRFNASEPLTDLNGTVGFAGFVTNPTLPILIDALFPGATSIPATPRNDLVAAFVTGVSGLNQPDPQTNGGEMLRLNTSTPFTPVANQQDLGFLACDLAGFPNGRRPIDDVVDIELSVLEGAIRGDDDATAGTNESNPNNLQTCNLNAAGGPAIVNPGAVVNDGARPNAGDYLSVFPYLNTPLPGATSASAP